MTLVKLFAAFLVGATVGGVGACVVASLLVVGPMLKDDWA